MPEPRFEVEADYYVPLLNVLADFTQGAPKREVLAQFWKRYQERIPPAHLKPVASAPDEVVWANKVAWARNRLKDFGLIDASDHGIWCLSSNGRDWLTKNPNAHRVSGLTGKAPSPTQSRKRESPRPISKALPVGITYEMLEETKKLMPAEQFRSLWGSIYDQLLAEERSKAITVLSDKELVAAVRKPVRRIQDFLQGHGNDAPKSEELCDWIHFCYTLTLYQEGAALWQYVRQDEVNPWQYERAKKLAAVCRTLVVS